MASSMTSSKTLNGADAAVLPLARCAPGFARMGSAASVVRVFCTEEAESARPRAKTIEINRIGEKTDCEAWTDPAQSECLLRVPGGGQKIATRRLCVVGAWNADELTVQ